MFQDFAWNRLFEQSRNDNMLSQKVPQGPKGLVDRLVLFLSTTDAKLRVRALLIMQRIFSLATRRETLGKHLKGGRRGGELKIDWTKPPPRA